MMNRKKREDTVTFQAEEMNILCKKKKTTNDDEPANQSTFYIQRPFKKAHHEKSVEKQMKTTINSCFRSQRRIFIPL